jgi:hypothetical protein
MDSPIVITALTLLHVLILVYWLGGDLGAFYGSSFLTDPKRTLPERTMALKILNNVDMAPRTALILALPTGFGLACAKGWLTLPAYVPLLVALVCLVWLALAWSVHLSHGGNPGIKRIDIAIRWVVLAVLFAAGGLGLAGRIALPEFLALKMIILGACISLGLVVRRQLVPLFPAVRSMISDGATPATDKAIAGVISQTRPVVMLLWALLLCAAWLGIATPV